MISRYYRIAVVLGCLISVLLFQRISNAENGISYENVTLQLAWKHQFQFAGYYMAKEKGFYKEANLYVMIAEGGNGRFAREELQVGNAQYGVAGSELLLHRAAGDPFVVLAPIFQHSPSVLLVRADSGINTLQDLIDKKVMLLPGKKDADILAAFLSEGVPLDAFTRLDQSFDLNDLISGKTDAVSAYVTNEPWLLRERGVVPGIIKPLTYGVDLYSDCLFTTENEIKNNPDRVKRFLAASLKGWEYAMENRAETVSLILEKYHPNKTDSHLLYEANAISEIMLPDLIEIGHMNPGRWRHIAKIYEKLGLIDPGFSLDGFIYNPDTGKGRATLKKILLFSVPVVALVIFWVLFLMAGNKKLKKEINDRIAVENKLKESEEALRQSEELLNAIFQTAVDSIFVKGEDLSYKKINPAMERLCGKAESQIVGKSDNDLFEDEFAKNSRTIDKKVLKGEVVEEFSVKPTEGIERFFHTIKVPLRDHTGKITGLCGIARDITQQRRAEKEKINAQKVAAEHEKLALVGQIAGKMAHDFNNILGVIMGNAELAHLDTADPEAKRIFKLILNQTVRGKNLTRQLMAFAKDQEPKQSFFNITEKIDLVMDLMRKDLDGIRVIREEEGEIPDILADSGMIESALVNLIQNAIHATGKSESPGITVKTSLADEIVTISIEDNGCGIPEEHLKKIFDPSFTLKGNRDITNSYPAGTKGTGYGMSNVKKYVEKHKGEVRIDSVFGVGTTVSISLPVTHKELTETEKRLLAGESPCTERRILIVEDERDISDIQYRLLATEPYNHSVDVAEDGESAIHFIDSEPYDLISLDYYLTGNINGMHVYNHIRKTNPDVQILFVSGNIEFLESINSLKEKDPNIDHLSKPFRNMEYVQQINNRLSV